MTPYDVQSTRYDVRLVDEDGAVVSRQDVLAESYTAVLRQLSDVDEEAQRIEVYNEEGEKAGEVGVAYWRQRLLRRR